MNKQGLIRAHVTAKTKEDELSLSQEELNIQKAAFFSQGGKVTKHDIIIRDADYMTKGYRNGIKTKAG